MRTTTTDRSTNPNTRLSTIQQNPTFSTEDVEVFDDTTNDDRGSLQKNDNLERQEPQEFAFSVKENQARKYIDICVQAIIFSQNNVFIKSNFENSTLSLQEL